MSENIISLIIENIQTRNFSVNFPPSTNLNQDEIKIIQKFIEKSIKIIRNLNELITSNFAGSEMFEFPGKDLSSEIRDQGTLNMDLDFLFDETIWNKLIDYLGDTSSKMTNPDFGERTYVKNVESYLDSFILNDGTQDANDLTKITRSKIIGNLWQSMLFKVIVWISIGKQNNFSQIVLPIYFIKYLQLFKDMGSKTEISFSTINGNQFERNSSNIISQSFFNGTITGESLKIDQFDSPIATTTKFLYEFLMTRIADTDFMDTPTKYLFNSLAFFIPWAFFKDLNQSFTLINQLKQVIPFYHYNGNLVPSLLISKKVIPEKILTVSFEKFLNDTHVINHINHIDILDQGNSFDKDNYLDFIKSQLPKPNYQNDIISDHLFEVYKYEIYLIHDYYYNVELFKENHSTFQNLPFTEAIYPSVWSDNNLYKDWYFGIPPKTVLPGSWPRHRHSETLDDLPPYYLRPNAKLLEQFHSDLSASFIKLPESIMFREEQFLTQGIDTDRTFFILKEVSSQDLFSNLDDPVPLLGAGVTKDHVTAAFFWENLVRRRGDTDQFPVNETVEKIPQNSNLGMWVSEMKKVKPKGRENLVVLYDRLIAQLMAIAYYQSNMPKTKVIEEGKKTFVSEFVINVFERELNKDNDSAKPWLNGVFTNLSLATIQQPTLQPTQTATNFLALPPITPTAPIPPISPIPQPQPTPQLPQLPQTATNFLALPPIPPIPPIPQPQPLQPPLPQIPPTTSTTILVPITTLSPSYSDGGRRRSSPRRRRSNPRKVSSFFRRVRKPKRRSHRSPRRKSSSRHRR